MVEVLDKKGVKRKVLEKKITHDNVVRRKSFNTSAYDVNKVTSAESLKISTLMK